MLILKDFVERKVKWKTYLINLIVKKKLIIIIGKSMFTS